nr:hypothetical protein [Tanacetum cinerariifolium]
MASFAGLSFLGGGGVLGLGENGALLGIPTGSDKFPLPEQLPTANEDKFPLLIQSDANAEELYAAAEVKEILVNKSHNKTPYELFNGRTPAIGFLKPFGCHVMILNTLDHLWKFKAQELEITILKARIMLLEDKDGGVSEQSGDDAPIKGRSLESGDETGAKRKKDSDDTKEMVNVLTSLDAATTLSSGVSESISPVIEVYVADIPTGSGSIPTASPFGTGVPTGGVPTGSDVVPTASLIFTTATVATPYTRRKGKEKMVESDTPKKKKLQEQIDIQVAREIEQQMIREDQRRNENNETIAKYLQEYYQFATEFPIGERIELINDLVKYQDNYAKVLKHFKGMTLEEIKEKFDPVWKQIQDFIPIGSKEESERFKRKGVSLEQDSAKMVKTSKEVPEEKLKEIMELIPVEEVYVEALQVKYPIIDWEVHTEGERSYWKIIRMGGSTSQWKLYDTCGVHHVISKDQEMFMLVEKDYPLRKGLAIVMICIPTRCDKFPLPEELPTANEDKFPLLIQSDATAEELCAAAEVKV